MCEPKEADRLQRLTGSENEVSSGRLLEYVAAIKQLLKYFTDRFTNFRLEKRKLDLFEMLFLCGHNEKNEVILHVQEGEEGFQEAVNGGSCDELGAFIFLHFSRKAPPIVELHIKNVCGSVHLCVTSVEVITCKYSYKFIRASRFAADTARPF